MYKRLFLVISLGFCYCHAFPTNDLTESVDDAIRRRAMENTDLFEGDIVLGSKQRFGHSSKAYLWPNKTVPFQITTAISSSLRKTIKAAMEHISEKTCIRFKEWSKERNYVRIMRGGGCYSQVGMQRWGGQDLSLGYGCERFSTVVHELMHAIGFWHQHSRSDRDEYLNIHWENIRPNAHNQFFKLSSYNGRIFSPFDYGSIMLYGPYAFTKNGYVTLSAKKPGIRLTSPSSNKQLSASDALSINKLYSCV